MKPSIPDAHADQNVFLVALAGIVYRSERKHPDQVAHPV
jgi:hypothetical protein